MITRVKDFTEKYDVAFQDGLKPNWIDIAIKPLAAELCELLSCKQYEIIDYLRKSDKSRKVDFAGICIYFYHHSTFKSRKRLERENCFSITLEPDFFPDKLSLFRMVYNDDTKTEVPVPIYPETLLSSLAQFITIDRERQLIARNKKDQPTWL